MTKTPSLSDFDGLYNFRGDADEPALLTESRLPKLTFVEEEAVKKTLTHILMDDAIRKGMPADEALATFEYCVGPGGVHDRTLPLDLPFEPSIEVILSMQEILLREFPLWRLLIPGYEPRYSVLIYPTAIRAGDHEPNRWQEYIHAIWQENEDEQDRRWGPSRRKRKLLLTVDWNRIALTDGPKLCVVYDEEDENAEYRFLWVLQANADPDAYLTRNNEVSLQCYWPIRDDGRQGPLLSKQKCRRLLFEWLVVAPSLTTLTLEPAAPRGAKKTFKLPLDQALQVNDARLQTKDGVEATARLIERV